MIHLFGGGPRKGVCVQRVSWSWSVGFAIEIPRCEALDGSHNERRAVYPLPYVRILLFIFDWLQADSSTFVSSFETLCP